MSGKECLSAIAIVMTFAAFLPYIHSIKFGKTRPHVFSWVIWGSVTIIVFAAQLADKGGAGAWPIGVSGLITIYVAVIAFQRKSDTIITRSDWCFFAVAMLSIPVWYITANPLWAVVVLTFIDVIGFIPTLRKSYHHPEQEALSFYVLIALRNATAMLALEHYSVTTVLFPLMTGLACVVFILVVVWRRPQVP